MNYLIAEFKADNDYLHHFELLLKTKLGFEPVMSWHAQTGDKPKMFNTREDAQNYYDEIKGDISQVKWDSDKRIVFVPAQDGDIEHYEIKEKGLFKWTSVMTWHPMSGDRPAMFDTWAKAKLSLDESNRTKKLRF